MCPPLYGFVPPPNNISLMGLRTQPVPFVKGGKVLKKHQNIPKQSLKKGDPDTVYARVQAGELVIPKKHVKKVSAYLKKEKIKLPHM